MKKLTFLLLLSLLPVLSNAQNFDKYEDNKDVNSAVVTSKMFKLLTNIDLNADDPETQQYIDLIENLKEMRVLSTESSIVQKQMAEDVAAYLEKGSLEELMRVSEDGKSVKFYYRPGKSENYVSELFMFVNGNSEDPSVILEITGEINLAQVAKLAQDFDIPAGKQLEKIQTEK